MTIDTIPQHRMNGYTMVDGEPVCLGAEPADPADVFGPTVGELACQEDRPAYLRHRADILRRMADQHDAKALELRTEAQGLIALSEVEQWNAERGQGAGQ